MTSESTAADLRTEAAYDLLIRAQDAPQELAVLSGLELCVLGAPKHVLCEKELAAAWLGYSDRRRRKAMQLATESLVKRSMLLERSGTPRTGPEGISPVDSYAMNPALGLVLAGRTRPGFVVVTSLGPAEARTPRMYSIGDEEQPVRGVLFESPESLPPGDFPHVVRMGPLGWMYRYLLTSQDFVADWLAAWVDKPAPEALRAKDGRLPPRMVSVYRHDEGRDFLGVTIAFRHDGERAQLLAEDGEVAGEYDREGLRGVMGDLLVAGTR